MSDRRKSTVIREIVVPVVVSVIVGVGSSFMATRVAIAVLDEKVKIIQRDLTNVGELARVMQALQVQVAKDSERITRNEQTGRRDYEALMREIDLRHRGEER